MYPINCTLIICSVSVWSVPGKTYLLTWKLLVKKRHCWMTSLETCSSKALWHSEEAGGGRREEEEEEKRKKAILNKYLSNKPSAILNLVSFGKLSGSKCWPWVTYAHLKLRSEGRMRRSVYPLALKSCPIPKMHPWAWSKARSSNGYRGKSQSGMRQQGWLISASSTLAGWRKMVQDKE